MPSSVPRSAPYCSCSSYASFAVADGDGKGVGGANRSARRSRQESINEVGVRVSRIPHHGSLLISGLSYKTAFSNELLTSIFPL